MSHQPINIFETEAHHTGDFTGMRPQDFKDLMILVGESTDLNIDHEHPMANFDGTIHAHATETGYEDVAGFEVEKKHTMMTLMNDTVFNGRCFLLIAMAMPQLRNKDAANCFTFISLLYRKTSDWMLFNDFIAVMYIQYERLFGSISNSDSVTAKFSKTVNDLLKGSFFKYKYEENELGYHVTYGGRNTIEEELVDHRGFTTRMLIPILMNKKVGGDIFDELFGVGADREETVKVEQGFTVNHGDMPRPLRTDLGLKTPPTERTCDPETETLGPDDSSSDVDRYEKHFMAPGTVFTRMNGKAKTVCYTLPAVPEVVQGFIKTDAMASEEVMNYHRITPINGLPNPFKSSRLNFLINLYSVLEKAITSKSLSLLEEIYRVSNGTSRVPGELLVKQVVTLTLSWQNKVFVANPFSLPYIEVGMEVTEESLSSCFDLLRYEYQTLWFSQMKDLKVPDFYNKYQRNRRRSSQDSNSTRSSGGHKSDSSPMTVVKRRDSGSVLSVFSRSK